MNERNIMIALAALMALSLSSGVTKVFSVSMGPVLHSLEQATGLWQTDGRTKWERK